jgi:hypothetical protein
MYIDAQLEQFGCLLYSTDNLPQRQDFLAFVKAINDISAGVPEDSPVAG